MSKNKDLIVISQNIFSKIKNFIKNLFYKKHEEEITNVEYDNNDSIVEKDNKDFENSIKVDVLNINTENSAIEEIDNMLDDELYADLLYECDNESSYDKSKIKYVIYDTDPNYDGNGEDEVHEDYIIRRSPFMKAITEPVDYPKTQLTPEEKVAMMIKYQNYIDGKISASEIDEDEISIIKKLLSKEIEEKTSKLNNA